MDQFHTMKNSDITQLWQILLDTLQACDMHNTSQFVTALNCCCNMNLSYKWKFTNFLKKLKVRFFSLETPSFLSLST